MLIPVEQIIPNPEQPREEFDQAGLEELAASIKEHGLMNPISVFRDQEQFVIIDGERRWRAHKIAGLDTIKADLTVKPNHGRERETLLEMAWIGNVQRKQMNPVEEGKAVAKMLASGKSYAELARKRGVTETTLRTFVAISELDPEIQEFYASGQIAIEWRVISAIRDLPDDIRVEVIRGCVKRKASGAAIYHLCKRLTNGRTPPPVPVTQAEVKTGSMVSCPVISYEVGLKKSKQDGIDEEHWNAMAQAMLVPPWPQISEAIIGTCKKCAVYSVASFTNCRECPLVDLIGLICKV